MQGARHAFRCASYHLTPVSEGAESLPISALAASRQTLDRGDSRTRLVRLEERHPLQLRSSGVARVRDATPRTPQPLQSLAGVGRLHACGSENRGAGRERSREERCAPVYHEVVEGGARHQHRHHREAERAKNLAARCVRCGCAVPRNLFWILIGTRPVAHHRNEV
jgi:hypothetical protein